MFRWTYLKSQNADYIEELFQRYLADPNSVDESWQYFFEGIEIGSETPSEDHRVSGSNGNGAHASGNGKASAGAALSVVPGASTVVAMGDSVSKEAKVGELIQTYREHGLQIADINPLVKPDASHPLLELKHFDLSEADLDRKFTAGKIAGMSQAASLREILAHLKETYCGTIGVEFTHIQDRAMRQWLQDRMESTRNRPQLDRETKKRIYQKLVEAECFERFLHTRYVAQKRFSVEGGDGLIPVLDMLVLEAAETGAADVVMGMAHRGRLNVLTNIFGKKYEYVFNEFDGILASDAAGGEGDVKYHMGYSSDWTTPSGKKIHLSLASNPSHLEFVNPVVVGMARAKLRQRLVAEGHILSGGKIAEFSRVFKKVIPVQIHGDAAFAGQGVVYETVQMSQLKGYNTGGSIHIVVNNQVGFTTNPDDSRSTKFSTDLAKMLDAPIFHVNGDDAEACAHAIRLAVQFRQQFHRDVAIDLICYRKYGHNEGDEPNFTQPLMYRKIKDHPSPREVYAKSLVSQGVMTEAETAESVKAMNDRLAECHARARSTKEPPVISVFEGAWKGLRKADDQDVFKPIDTKVPEGVLQQIAAKISVAPSGFQPHAKLVRVLEARGQVVAKGEGIDWGTAEALAFGSIVLEGTPVRITGQDAERGTFSHRHSVLYDFNTNASYCSLNALDPKQAEYAVHNSPLSETSVLGFEYGYALAEPRSLVIWEAQFGDFANGAQVIIDQFLTSSETKWQRMCGLVLLLPHGYEGQGPEHSSARLERFLQLCAKQNLQVANLTTPAQIFHALRRQVRRDFRKPLVVMSPKSLLRHPAAISKLSDLSQGSFEEVLGDPTITNKTRKVLFCTGKVFYDLAAARAERKLADVGIVRVEQLYPWPEAKVAAVIQKVSSSAEVAWVQEEPRNMGAWSFVRDPLGEQIGSRKLAYVGRAAAAAPAVGSSKVHEREQKSIIEEALK